MVKSSLTGVRATWVWCRDGAHDRNGRTGFGSIPDGWTKNVEESPTKRMIESGLGRKSVKKKDRRN